MMMPKKLYDEFDKKYKIILEDNTKCIEQYKTLNDKLKKQNDSLRKQSAQTRHKSEKTKDESKALKKTNHKLDKKVTTLGNLCRDLQARLKEAQSQLSEQTSEETNILKKKFFVKVLLFPFQSLASPFFNYTFFCTLNFTTTNSLFEM